MIRAIGDDHSNVLYLMLQENRLIANSEAITTHATIDLALDGSPIGVAIRGYFTPSIRSWPFTDEIMIKYHLEEWAEDLKVVYQGMFDPYHGLGAGGMRLEYDPID